MTGKVTLSNPSYNSNIDIQPLSLDTNGGLRVHVIADDAGGSGGTSSTFGGAFPTSGTAIGVKNGSNMTNLTADGSNNLNVNLAANSFGTVTITGAVSVSNFPATQPVSGTVAATQSGAWTVGVNNFPATQPVSGTIAVSNFPATQPVSGTVSIGNLPSVQSVSVSSLPLPYNAAQEQAGQLQQILEVLTAILVELKVNTYFQQINCANREDLNSIRNDNLTPYTLQ
jgi:hypothetical protein